MKQVSKRTVLSYRYDSEKEAKMHEKIMITDGWHVDSTSSYFLENFRQYSREMLIGALL